MALLLLDQLHLLLRTNFSIRVLLQTTVMARISRATLAKEDLYAVTVESLVTSWKNVTSLLDFLLVTSNKEGLRRLIRLWLMIIKVNMRLCIKIIPSLLLQRSTNSCFLYWTLMLPLLVIPMMLLPQPILLFQVIFVLLFKILFAWICNIPFLPQIQPTKQFLVSKLRFLTLGQQIILSILSNYSLKLLVPSHLLFNYLMVKELLSHTLALFKLQLA